MCFLLLSRYQLCEKTWLHWYHLQAAAAVCTWKQPGWMVYETRLDQRSPRLVWAVYKPARVAERTTNSRLTVYHCSCCCSLLTCHPCGTMRPRPFCSLS